MTSEEYEEDQQVLLLEARTAICRVEYLLELLSYLLRDWPMTKRLIDLEIEKNKETNHLHQRDCRKAIQEECMSHRLTTNHGITVKAPLKWEPVIKIVWCN